MSIRTARVCVSLAVVLLAALPAQAQYGDQPISNRATGENYHVEISGNLWDPTPSIIINSESIQGILGSDIDAVLSSDETRIAYVQQTSSMRLWAFPFDAAERRLTGAAEPTRVPELEAKPPVQGSMHTPKWRLSRRASSGGDRTSWRACLPGRRGGAGLSSGAGPRRWPS